jgi:hypothetical protein
VPRRGGTPRILPFIRDLNPQTDDFPGLIALIRNHQGNRPALVRAIYKKWTKDANRHGFSLHSIDANTVSSLGLDNLGIIDDDCRLTDLGNRLYKDRTRSDVFKELLAIHLLQHRAGWQFARALEVLRRRVSRPSREDIAEYLGAKYGITEWRDLNNISSLHSFLEWCGVVSSYQLNGAEFERLLGASVADVGLLERFTLETRAYLQALVRLDGSATGREIREAAETYLRRHLDPHKVPTRMEPLIDAGLVQFSGRRGSRTSRYTIVDDKRAALLAEVSADLIAVGSVPDEVFEHDFRWTVDRLKDQALSRDEKGRTLEVLAAMICWRLGLRRVLLRERTEYEVDVTAEFLAGGYQTWSAQCKAYGNAQIRSAHILREFGIAVLDSYSVLLFVTTADFTPDAVSTAERIMRQSPVQVLMLNGADLDSIAEKEESLFEIVGERSEEVRRLRSGDSPWIVFRELDAVRDWIWNDHPKPEEVWLYLERRDFNTSREMVAALLFAWLESQRDAEGFDAKYLSSVR